MFYVKYLKLKNEFCIIAVFHATYCIELCLIASTLLSPPRYLLVEEGSFNSMSFVSQWAYEFEHAIVTELAIRSITDKINTSTGQPISTSKFILICASRYFDLTPFPDNQA